MNRIDIEKELNSFYDFNSTVNKLKRAGLVMPTKPQDAVEGIDLSMEWEKMKKKHGGIAQIPFNDLGDFLDRWTSLISYSRWCEAVADIEQQASREMRDTVKKQLYTIQDGSREIRDASVCIEPIYRQIEQKYTEDLATYLAIKGLREGYEQRAGAISREITRRCQEYKDIGRSNNRGY